MRQVTSRTAISLLGLVLLSCLFMSCSQSRLTHHKEWGDYFHDNNLEGCVMWNNYKEGTFEVYGFGAVQKRLVPAETFNIVLALAGIETGVIRDTSMRIPDSLGIKKLSGITMGEAFRNNNEAYFQWVSQRIGKTKLKFWIDSTYYGNKSIGNNLSTFWTNQTLKISPDEQLGLMQRLYRGKLRYQKRTKEMVKQLMIKKVVHDDTLRYQQGVGHGADGTIAWLVGWLQRKDAVSLFSIKALDTHGEKAKDLNAKTLNILYSIFREKDISRSLTD